MLVNVKLIVGTDVEPPGLTRLQAAAPPHINGRTLLGLPVEATTTVAALKKQVAGAWPRRGARGRARRGREAKRLRTEATQTRRREAARRPWRARRAAVCETARC